MALISSVGQIAVPVEDLPRAIEFYRDTLGLLFLFEAPPGMAFFKCGDVRLMLTKEKPAGAVYSSIIYYKTDNIQKAAEVLEARGVVFKEKPAMIAKMRDHDLWIGTFRDSEGNLVALMCEVR